MSSVRFAKSYLDRLFAERDLVLLHHLISVVERDRSLPEEFWLFHRVLEWVGSTRSGVWQYYESLPNEIYERMNQALDHFGLRDVAEKYRLGRSTWNLPDQAAAVDGWIDRHEEEIETAVLNLILTRKDCLYDQS